MKTWSHTQPLSMKSLLSTDNDKLLTSHQASLQFTHYPQYSLSINLYQTEYHPAKEKMTTPGLFLWAKYPPCWAAMFPFLLCFQELFDFIPLLFLQILVWKFYFIFNHYKLLPVWLSGLSLFLVCKQIWLQEPRGPLWTNVTVIITASPSFIYTRITAWQNFVWTVELFWTLVH